jgi:P4 family phage/plasmid primase-like protien
MEQSLVKFLRSSRVDGVIHSHVSLFQPRGKYHLDKKSLDSFWDKISNILINNVDSPFGIAEKSQQYLPPLVDADIKIPSKLGEKLTKLYKEHHITDIISIYQSILRDIVIDCKDSDLTCFVLEKDPYLVESGDKYYHKSGFHLHFPFIFLNKKVHDIHLLPRVTSLIEEQNIFQDLDENIVKDKIIDKSYLKVPWLVYGGRKTEKSKSYKLTNVYNSTLDPITLDEALIDYSIFDQFENEIEMTNKKEFYLPRILSILPYGRKVHEVRSNLFSPLKVNIKNIDKVDGKKVRKQSIEEEIKIAKRLLRIISSERANDYNDWMNVGWALFNIGHGCKETLDLWLDFSKQCDEKFDENSCIHEWNQMVLKDMTLGTLKYFAKQDNPVDYQKFVDENTERHVENSLEGSHNDIAKILYENYSDEFICGSIISKEWYQFKSHRWREVEEGVYLRSKISADMIQHFITLRNQFMEKQAADTKIAEDKMWEEKRKQASRMINNLKSAPYKNNVMKEAQEVFYDEKFAKKLDSNRYLIGFNNGVYDLKKNIFRDGIPEDYISMKMNVDYDVSLTENDPSVQDVHDFLEQIFPDTTVRNYFLDVSSDVFIGGNQRKLVMVWSGEGDNGKSVTQHIFEKMLGDYAIKLPTSLITGKRTQASQACPELARAGNGVRWAVLQEPDSKDTINTGILKELSGNDTFYARKLHKDGKEITPMFKLVLICNEPPKLPYNDKATWNRIRVIPFESTFCDNPPEEYEEQLRQKKFKKDPFFDIKVPKLIKAFAWVLLNYRKNFKRSAEPDKVKLATANYRKQNDIYRQFVEECIVEEKEASITLVELYGHFKEWFKESFPSRFGSLPNKNEIKDYFSKLWGDPENLKWDNYKIKTLRDDIKNGDAIILEEKDLINYDGKPPL